jgi:hypothetical protein
MIIAGTAIALTVWALFFALVATIYLAGSALIERITS